jgi:hypothetical protein
MSFNRPDLTALIQERVRHAVADVMATEINRVSCLSCVHFKEHEGELCNLYKQRPPAKVIAAGCESYMDNRGVPY